MDPKKIVKIIKDILEDHENRVLTDEYDLGFSKGVALVCNRLLAEFPKVVSEPWEIRHIDRWHDNKWVEYWYVVRYVGDTHEYLHKNGRTSSYAYVPEDRRYSKGMSCGLFTGYFDSKEEAEEAVKKYNSSK